MLWRYFGYAEHGTNAAARHGRDAIHANFIHPTHSGTNHWAVRPNRCPNR